MGKLDYYDDETIMKKIKFFKIKKLFRLSPFIPLITVFWCFIPKNCENSDFRNINVFIGILLLCINFLFAIKYCFALFYKDTSYSKSEIIELKNEYNCKRGEILKKHKYNFSIYTVFPEECDEIFQEVMCDNFSVEHGDVLVFEKGNCILKTPYHHIVDNRDGHTITVEELKEKYLIKNSEDNKNE